jgi:hypothetical protein
MKMHINLFPKLFIISKVKLTRYILTLFRVIIKDVQRIIGHYVSHYYESSIVPKLKYCMILLTS